MYQFLSGPPSAVRLKRPLVCARLTERNRSLPNTKLASPLYNGVGPFWSYVVSGGRVALAPRPNFCLLPRKYVKLVRMPGETCPVSLNELSCSSVRSWPPVSVTMSTCVLPVAPHAHSLFFTSGPPSSTP